MTQPTKEQRFWEQLGWEFTADGQYYRVCPDASGWAPIRLLPRIDSFEFLGYLFKYAVPELLIKYDLKMFSFRDDLNNNEIFWFVQALDKVTLDVEFANIEGYPELKDAIFEVCYEALGGKE